MRRGWLLLGATFTAIFLVLGLFPLVPVNGGSQQVGNGGFADTLAQGLVWEQFFTVSWSAQQGTVQLTALDCGATAPTSANPCPHPHNATQVMVQGSHGSFSLGIPVGHYLVVEAVGVATISERDTPSTTALPMIGVGLALVIAGVALPRGTEEDGATGSERASAAEAPSPETPGPGSDAPKSAPAPSEAPVTETDGAASGTGTP